MNRFLLLGILPVLSLMAGCMSDDFARVDGVTGRGGNAIAANSVLQIVDPWPYGVENSRLRVPAERAAGEGQSPGSDDAGGSVTTARD